MSTRVGFFTRPIMLQLFMRANQRVPSHGQHKKFHENVNHIVILFLKQSEQTEAHANRTQPSPVRDRIAVR